MNVRKLIRCMKASPSSEPSNTVLPIIANGVAGIRVALRARTDITAMLGSKTHAARHHSWPAPLRRDAALRRS